MGWLKDIFAEFLTVTDDGGAAKPARLTLNFGQGIKVTDNEALQRLDIEIPTTSATEAGLLPVTTGADKVLCAPANVPTWAKLGVANFASTTARYVLNADGAGVVQWGLLVNANIDAAAAIAGSKVAPDFGAQDITTTGILKVGGANPATTSSIRLPNSGGMWARNAANTQNVRLAEIDNSNNVFLGDSSQGANTFLNCAPGSTIFFRSSSTNIFTASYPSSVSTIQFPAGASGADIKYEQHASGAGNALQIIGQNAGGGNGAGGTVSILGGAGNGTGAYGDILLTGRARFHQVTQAMADADQTLSTANARAEMIILTGANTADRTLTMGPAQQGMPFFVDNRCTGAFGVTIKCATGTGIKVGNVRGALLYCDGTNVFRLCADTITTV